MKKSTTNFLQFVALLFLFLIVSNNVFAVKLKNGESITFKIDDSKAKQSDGWNGGPYFYAWDESDNALAGGWPGTEIGAKEYIIREGTEIPAGVVLSSKYDWGGNKGKTNNIKDCNGAAFEPNSTYVITLTGSFSGDRENRIFAYTIEKTSGGGGSSSGNLKEPYIISVYKKPDGAGKHFTFTPIPGSTNYEYEVNFEIPEYTGKTSDYAFWVGESGAWSGTYSENKPLNSIVAECETGVFHAKIYVLDSNGAPHAGTYKNYGIHDVVCSESPAKLLLTSDVREFDKAEPPTSITLIATADDKTEGNYFWYKSSDEGKTYEEIGETANNTYTITDIPEGTRNYYKVERKLVDSSNNKSAIIVIYTIQSCGKDTKGSNVFRETFGDLTALEGQGSRKSFPGINKDLYKYQEAPKKINDGFYAVVADPYYCGCGEGYNMNEDVDTNCLNRNSWFRQLRDNTLNNTSDTAPFGGMLLINFKEKGGIAYERELTADEKQSITKNSILKFSAYFASAAKDDPSFKGINMKLSILFKKNGTRDWKEANFISSTVKFSDNWDYQTVDWKVEDADGDFKVVIENNSDTGFGNDLLVDDISLDLCTPAFALYFVDEEGNMTEELETQSINDTAKIQIQKIDFGSLGTDPCMQLYQRIVNGTDTSYVYNSDLTLSEGYYITDVLANSIFTEVPGTVEMVAVASAKENGACAASVKTGVEDGEYKPGQQTNVVFSGNYLTYTIGCGTSLLTLSDGEKSSICLTDDLVMPKLTLSSTNVGTVVKMDVLVDDTAILTNIPYSSEINITELYKTNNAGAIYYPEKGERTITVKVREYNEEGEVFCERLANGEVKIIVLGNSAAPITNRPGEHYAYNMCKTENTEEGKETDPNVIDNKYFFKDYLILAGEDKSGLVWLDMNGNKIPDEEAFFYADEVQDKSVKVYNNPSGSCPSETITVYYRVKAYTPEPVFTKDYNECALGEPAELIELESFVDVEKSFENFDEPGVTKAYKYVDFINQETKQKEITFDPKVPGTRKYTVKVSLDETSSASNNYCESEAEYTVKVKGNATVDNISANDATVCPDSLLVLIAKPNFTEEQKNVKLTWYADKTYERTLAYGETFKYHLIDNAYKVNPDTVYVTVQTDDYCENIPKEAHPVVVTQKEAAPSLNIEPKEQTISVGGVPSFTVSPAGEQKYLLYVNDKKVDKTIEEFKPYIDSQYKLVYEGECGSSYDSARVEVQWPTVFTPYVIDGRNDTFVQDMDPNFKTQIFTRFGTKIYESPNGWDGKVQGAMNGRPDKIAVPGVYYYVVELPDGSVKKGTIEVFKY